MNLYIKKLSKNFKFIKKYISNEIGGQQEGGKIKRTVKDKLYFIVFGKYPEQKEVEEVEEVEDLDENQEIEESNKSSKSSDEEQEKLFQEKTKMTLLQAEKKVKKWNEAGETTKVKSGVKMILEFFPNHEFRKINLSKNKSKKIEEGTEGITKKTAKKSLFSKVASNPSHGFDVSAEFLEKNGLPQEADVNDDERVFGALSYFPLLSFFVLATRKDSPFVSYHGWNSFAIFAIFLLSVPFAWIFGIIPGISFLFYLLYLSLFFISIYAGFLAWSGRYIKIPVISAFAMKLAGK